MAQIPKSTRCTGCKTILIIELKDQYIGYSHDFLEDLICDGDDFWCLQCAEHYEVYGSVTAADTQ